MNNYGFVKIACAVPFGKVGDCDFNTKKIIAAIKKASAEKTSAVVFPELAVTSYTCGELFSNSSLIRKAHDSLIEICEKTKTLPILAVVGTPFLYRNKLYNCAAVLHKGTIIGMVPKSYIPNYKEFYENRWFTSGIDIVYEEAKIKKHVFPFGTALLFRDTENENLIVGVELCEDLWHVSPPSSLQAQGGATVLCNLSASNALIAKDEYRHVLIHSQSAKCVAAYAYCNTGMGESTTDVVFDAGSTIYENGVILADSERFKREDQIIFADVDIERLVFERSRLNTYVSVKEGFMFVDFKGQKNTGIFNREVDAHPFVPGNMAVLAGRCEEIMNIQASALCKRLETLDKPKVVIGLSGGLDSTLALLVVIRAFDILKMPRSNIIPLTMPGPGTSETTLNNVISLCRMLKLKYQKIPIEQISDAVYKLVKYDKKKKDVVFENVQARARTLLLMTRANQENGIVIGTGDLSEIALGFATYSGDHISMYNVNASVPKTLIRFLIQWYAHRMGGEIKKLLVKIAEQPISPELLPPNGKDIAQKTEEIIGPYELHDFFLYYLVRFGFSYDKILFLAVHAFRGKYTKQIIEKWLMLFFRRFMQNQWKRDCVPAGPKVGSIDLSPRGSWRMPSEIDWKKFL